MGRQVIPYEEALQQQAEAESGLNALKRALDHFKASDNKQTQKRIRLAISSAKGAIRICSLRRYRSERP